MLTKDRWFPYKALFARPGARLRLFCLPHAGGGAVVYRQWHAALPPSVEVCPIELPGRLARLGEPPYRTMPELTRDLAEVMTPLLDRPFALFGYSMGGLVAFELARELRRRVRIEPARLVVAARAAPDSVGPDAALHLLPQAELIEEVSRRWGGLPAALLASPEMLELSLGVLRADIGLLTRYEYQPEPPLACPLDVFGGTRDGSVVKADLERWRAHTTGLSTVHWFDGGHFFRDERPEDFLAAVAARLESPAGPSPKEQARV